MRKIIINLGVNKSILVLSAFAVLISLLITASVLFTMQSSGLEVAYFPTLIVTSIAPLVITPLVTWQILHSFIECDQLEQKMREIATHDFLTGALSRYAFFENANNYFSLAQRQNTTFSILLVDLDDFKNINDKYGHEGGDDVLKSFTKISLSLLRKGDLLGRIGGDEFAILLANAPENMANKYSHRLHASLKKHSVNHYENLIKYSVSIGITSFTKDKSKDIEELLRNADKALYLAKDQPDEHTYTYIADQPNSAN